MTASFMDEVRALAAGRDESLNSSERAYLAHLAKSNQLEDVRKGIEKYYGNVERPKMLSFVCDIARARFQAADADQLSSYVVIAQFSERVVGFLTNGSLSPSLQRFAVQMHIAWLEELASCFRREGTRLPISRHKQRRQRILFTRLLSRKMIEYFGRCYDKEVAALANIFFSEGSATRESVRAARRKGETKRAA